MKPITIESLRARSLEIQRGTEYALSTRTSQLAWTQAFAEAVTERLLELEARFKAEAEQTLWISAFAEGVSQRLDALEARLALLEENHR